jgi:hypothetical protein
MTSRRQQLRYQLAPLPRRPRTGPPPAPGPMIAGPDTIWRERQPPPPEPDTQLENSHQNNNNV